MIKHAPLLHTHVASATPSVRGEATFEICIEQADTCCEQARVAARQRRYGAAHGLLVTAAALYRRAIAMDGVSYHAIEQRLSDIEGETAIYMQLDKRVIQPHQDRIIDASYETLT